MKTIKTKPIKMMAATIATACLFMYYLSSCNKEAVAPETPGKVTFQLRSVDKGNTGGKMEAGDAESVIVTILDSNADTVYNQHQIQLFNFEDEYISGPISLNPGDYELVTFLVLDADDDVIYATPVEGSPLAHLVTDPLGIDFAITQDVVTQVVPEVLESEGFTPEDFGYVTFKFEVVETNYFLIAAFIYDALADNFALTEATLTVTGDNVALFSTELIDSTNAVTAPQDYANYTLSISKPDYLTVDTVLTEAQLQSYADDPIEIILLEPSLSSGNVEDSEQHLSNVTVQLSCLII